MFCALGVDAGASAKSLANWVLRDLLQALKENDAALDEVAMTPEILSALVGLVDGAGQIRGYYDSSVDESIDQLITDAKMLAIEKS